MNEPQPIEYELETEEKPPETEAEAVARVRREEEEQARRMGLMRPKGTGVPARWQDQLGGPQAVASRLIEQEQRLVERKMMARGAAARLVFGLVAAVVVLAGLGALAGDYFGAIDLGVFRRRLPDPELVAGQDQPGARVHGGGQAPTPELGDQPDRARRAPIVVLGVVGESQPIENPPSEEAPRTQASLPQGAVGAGAEAVPRASPAELRRAKDRVEARKRGVASVQKDLDAIDSRIRERVRLLYGRVPKVRDSIPERYDWLRPCAMIEQEEAYAEARPSTTSMIARWMTRRENADVAVRNLTRELASDRKLEKDIEQRMVKAKREQQEAQDSEAKLLIPEAGQISQ